MNPSAIRARCPRAARPALAGCLVLVFALAVRAARADDPAPASPPPSPAPSPAPAPAPVARPVAPVDAIDAIRLEAHVKTLASDEFGGRGSADDREKAARWVEKELIAAGVKPVPGETSMLRPFEAARAKGVPSGRNVVGWIEGADPQAKEYVVLSAHFDHLGTEVRSEPLPSEEPGKVVDGVRTTTIPHPGADDNASGTAALIEIARALVAGPRPRRPVLVLAFDLEERDCGGSRAYCAAPVRPLADCAAFTTMDMLGRSLGDLAPGVLLVMGAERADALMATTGAMAVASGVTIRELGMDFNQLGWSDYVPFEEKKVPSLFFTSGACRDYHQPGDTADKLDYAALRGRAATVLAAIRALGDAKERPVWKETAQPRLVEIESVHAIVKLAGEKEEELQIPPPMRMLRKNYENNLAKTIAKGTVTVGERVALRNLALMLFQAATKAR